jgi:hypothetical protein
LISKRREIIIDNDHVLLLPVDDPEIFDIKALLAESATVPEQPMRNKLVAGIQEIDDGVSVTRLTRCEYYYFELKRQTLQEFAHMRSDVDASLILNKRLL